MIVLSKGDWKAAVRIILAGHRRAIDVGQVRTSDDSYVFLNIVGFGLPALAMKTAEKLKKLGQSAYTLSVLREVMRLQTHDLDIEIEKGAGDAAYLDILGDTLHRLQRLVTPDLVIYDAGVDVHEGDRLGLLDLTYDGIRQRDAMVLRHFRARGIPVATVIGGGYGSDIDEVAFRHSLVFHAAAAEYTGNGGA